MLRLFTCVWVPDELKERVIKLQEELKKVHISAKFVERENLHLTISFLGNVKEEDVNSLKKKLDIISNNIEKFKINLSGLKIIPNEHYVRVIGISVKDNKKMVDLIKSVGTNIGGKYYEINKLTLCRVKRAEDKKMLRIFIEKNRNIEIGEFEVKNIALVKSVITRNGPLYETLHTSELQ